MPKLFFWLACFSLLLVSANPVHAQSQTRETKPRNCSISGRVTIKGKPAVNATVIVTSADANQQEAMLLGQSEAVFAKTVTDGEGRYQVLNLPPGQLQVRTLSRAYVAVADEPERQSRGSDAGKMVSLRSGDQREGVDFDFVRGGVITGRVSESGGRPLPNEFVNLQRLDQAGKPLPADFGSQWSERLTDDRGIYRLFGIPAGRYVVSAGSGRGARDGNRQGYSGSQYMLRFHPDAAEQAQAKVLEVTEGGELTDINLLLVKAGKAEERRTFVARGRLLEAETGKPVAQARVNAFSENGGSQAFTDAQGGFQLDGLPSGKYQLNYQEPDPFQSTAQPGYYGEPVAFEIAEADASGIEMRLQRGATISGVLVIEGQRPAPRDQSRGMAIINANAVQDTERPNPSESNHAFGFVQADGQFKLVGLRPGRVKFEVEEILATENGLGRLRLVRIERNGVNLGQALEVAAKEQLTGVRVIVQRLTGVLRGQLNFTGAALPKDWARHWRFQVTLIKTELAQQRETTGTFTFGDVGVASSIAVVDESGRFELRSLQAGSFELTVTAVPRAQTAPNAPNPEAESPFEETRQTVFINAQGETNVTVTVKVKAGGRQ